MSTIAVPTPTAFRVGRRSRHRHRRLNREAAGLDSATSASSVAFGLFARIGLGLPAQFGRACSCGLGALLGTNELFFCCRERIWSFGGRGVGVGVRHWSWAIAGASTPRLTARSGLHTENHVITPKSLAGCAMRTCNIQCDVARMRSSPKKRIFLSPMQNYFRAFHRGDGGCADRSRRVDAADGCRRADCLRLPGLYSRHRSEHGSGRAVRQHHLLRIRGIRRLRARHTTRTADVLRLAQAIPAEMVPLPADGGHQGRERRLPGSF